MIHDLGHLTLTTQALTSPISMGPAVNKLPPIAHHSTLLLNRHFQRRSSWTETDIQQRSAILFDIAKQIWPGP